MSDYGPTRAHYSAHVGGPAPRSTVDSLGAPSLVRDGRHLSGVENASNSLPHLTLKCSIHRYAELLLQCVASRHERLDCGFDGRGHGADAHGPQELGVEPGHVLGDEIAAADGGFRGEPPNPVPEVRVNSGQGVPSGLQWR